MDKIDGCCSFFSLLIDNRALLDKEACICDVDSDFVNLILLQFIDIDVESVEVLGSYFFN